MSSLSCPPQCVRAPAPSHRFTAFSWSKEPNVIFVFVGRERMTFHQLRSKEKFLIKTLSLFLLLSQVKSEYEQLQEALYTVTVERDCALLERTELQGKLENLEQVLKVRTCHATVKKHLDLTFKRELAILCDTLKSGHALVLFRSWPPLSSVFFFTSIKPPVTSS